MQFLNKAMQKYHFRWLLNYAQSLTNLKDRKYDFLTNFVINRNFDEKQGERGERAKELEKYSRSDLNNSS